MTDPSSQTLRRRIATALLAIGALIGVGMAGAGLLQGNCQVPKDSIAVVNGIAISRTQFEQYAQLINANSRTEKERRYVLERMIDEELLVQRGVELGMVDLNSTVRNAIVQAVTRRFASTDDSSEIDDRELEAFYAANAGYFTPQSQYTVAVIKPEDFPLPAKPVTERTLTEYLGPTLTANVMALDEGTESTVLSSNGQAFKFRLLKKVVGNTPPLEYIRDQVEREYLRQQNQQAFDDYVAWLRSRADIAVLAPK